MAILAVQEPYAFQHEGFVEQLMKRLNYGESYPGFQIVKPARLETRRH